jgi:hypothetical protein
MRRLIFYVPIFVLVLILLVWLFLLTSPLTIPAFQSPTPEPTPTYTPTSTPTPTPTSTPTPTPTPTPTSTPTSTSTPDPRERYRKLDQIYFPILDQLRSIPGNENAWVDWELRNQYSGVVYTTPSGKQKGIVYVVYGVKKIPLDLLLPNIRDPRYVPEAGVYIQHGWLVAPNGLAIGWFLPDGRNGFACGEPLSLCRLDGDIIVVQEPKKGIWLTFVIFDNGEWGYTVPPWKGPLPPTK